MLESSSYSYLHVIYLSYMCKYMQQYMYRSLDRIVHGTVHRLIRLDIFQGDIYICLRFLRLSVYRTIRCP